MQQFQRFLSNKFKSSTTLRILPSSSIHIFQPLQPQSRLYILTTKPNRFTTTVPPTTIAPPLGILTNITFGQPSKPHNINYEDALELALQQEQELRRIDTIPTEQLLKLQQEQLIHKQKTIEQLQSQQKQLQTLQQQHKSQIDNMLHDYEQRQLQQNKKKTRNLFDSDSINNGTTNNTTTINNNDIQLRERQRLLNAQYDIVHSKYLSLLQDLNDEEELFGPDLSILHQKRDNNEDNDDGIDYTNEELEEIILQRLQLIKSIEERGIHSLSRDEFRTLSELREELIALNLLNEDDEFMKNAQWAPDFILQQRQQRQQMYEQLQQYRNDDDDDDDDNEDYDYDANDNDPGNIILAEIQKRNAFPLSELSEEELNEFEYQLDNRKFNKLTTITNNDDISIDAINNLSDDEFIRKLHDLPPNVPIPDFGLEPHDDDLMINDDHNDNSNNNTNNNNQQQQRQPIQSTLPPQTLSITPIELFHSDGTELDEEIVLFYGPLLPKPDPTNITAVQAYNKQQELLSNKKDELLATEYYYSPEMQNARREAELAQLRIQYEQEKELLSLYSDLEAYELYQKLSPQEIEELMNLLDDDDDDEDNYD